MVAALAGPVAAQVAYVGGDRDATNQQRLYVIDTTRDAVIRSLPGGATIDSIAAGADGRIVVYGSETPRDVTVAVIAPDGRRIGVVSVANPRSKASATSPDRRRVYLGSENIIQVVDVAGGKLVGKSDVRGLSTTDLAVAPDGRTLAIGDLSRGVVLLDTTSLKVTAVIAAATTPAGLAWAPSGAAVYLGDDDADAVAVVDVARRQVVRKIAVGRGPAALAVSADGRTLYVALRGSRDIVLSKPGVATLAVVDLASGRVRARVRLADRPTAVGLAGGDKAYVVDDAGVQVVALGRGQVAKTIAVGRNPPVAGPDFIAAAPATRPARP